MTQLILVTDQNGLTSSMWPAEEMREFGESDEAFLTRIAIRDCPAGSTWQIIDEADIPASIAPVPVSITRPQAAKQLYIMNLISSQEALAMSQSGAAPAFVMEQISLLDAKGQILAQIDFARYTFERAHPLLNALMQANGHSSEEIDDFFRQAGAL